MKTATRKNHWVLVLWTAVTGWTMIGSSLSYAFSIHDNSRRIHTLSSFAVNSRRNVGSIINTNINTDVVPNARSRSWTNNDMRLYATSNDDIVEPIIVQKILHNHNDNEEQKRDESIRIKMEQQQQTNTRKSRHYRHSVYPLILKWWKNFRTKLSSSTTTRTTTSANKQTQTRAQPQNQLRRKIMTLLASAVVMFAVLFTPLQDAFAAPSGGRMGGSFGGSSTSSTSYSSWSSGSYHYRSSVAIEPEESPIETLIWLLIVIACKKYFPTESSLGQGMTVAEITIALNVPRRNDPNSILSFLNSLSRTASTDSRVGVSNLVSQVSLELIRQKGSIFAADAQYRHYMDVEEAKRNFNQRALEERSKFEKEITNRYGGVDYGSRRSSGFDDTVSGIFVPQATSAVVTILIAIEGDITKFPKINNISDLQKALATIATDVKVDDCFRSAEVLWTPDDDVDVLTEPDIIVDYPNLRSV